MAVVLEEDLQTTGLEGPTVCKGSVDGTGHVRFSLASGASVLDPQNLPYQQDERTSVRTTDISKMKGQGLVCSANAKLIAVNMRFIAYAMKEGVVRVINQNGRDMFKLSNTTSAVITDMAINGTGVSTASGVTPTTLLCVDEAAHVSVFVLDFHNTGSHEERTKKIELVFPGSVDPPQRVLGHPTDNKSFVTVHAGHLGLWSLSQLERSTSHEWKPPSKHGFLSYRTDEQLTAYASTQFLLPGEASASSDNHFGPRPRLRDAAVSLNGKCLIALAEDALFVWGLSRNVGNAVEPPLLQKLCLSPASAASGTGLHSLRILADKKALVHSSEVLVLGSSSGCQLLAYEFKSSVSVRPVGSLLQSITLTSSNGDDLHGLLDTNSVNPEYLGIAFKNKTMVLLLPLALHWPKTTGMPFTYVRRIVTEEPAHQLNIMTGKSCQPNGQWSIFMYRAHNFTREKDKLMGCNIVVSEVEDPKLTQREEPSEPEREPAHPATEPEDPLNPWGAPVPLAKPVDSTEEETVTVDEYTDATLAPPLPEGMAGVVGMAVDQADEDTTAAEAEQPGVLEADAGGGRPPSTGAPGGAGRVCASPPGLELTADAVADQQRHVPDVPALMPPPGLTAAGQAPDDEDGDGCVLADRPAVSSSASPGQEAPGRKEREGQAEADWAYIKQIAAGFVRGLDKRRGVMTSSILKEVAEALKASGVAGGETDPELLEALSRVKDAREAQSSCDKSLQTAARKAADQWAEASSSAVASLLQKELGKISEGVAATLAQQLSQSRKFCEALARGVQKSGNLATKQALEALKPKALQETVGGALSDALAESLAPVLRQELRLHFETELAPLIGQRVGEMMASFRDRMGKCIEGIAAEQEQAGQRLGQDLAPIVAEELRQVDRIAAQHRSAASSQNLVMLDQQMDDIVATVQTEVVQPLQTQIESLNAQVQALREHSRRLEDRWQEARRSLAAAASAAPRGLNLAGVALPVPGPSAAEREDECVRDLQNTFRQGFVKDAFVKAMHLQVTAEHSDFLGSLCSMVPEDNLEEWFATGPLGQYPKVRMLLMISLARQLEGGGGGGVVSEDSMASKLEWIHELFCAFDPANPDVADNAASICEQLTEVLERVQQGQPSHDGQVRKLKRTVQQLAKVLQLK